MILVGSEPVWLLNYAFAYFSLHIFCFMFILILKYFAYALFLSAQAGEAKCVPAVDFFLFLGPPCCFRLPRGSLRNL